MAQPTTLAARLRLAAKVIWQPQSIAGLDEAMRESRFGRPTLSGVRVSEATAMNYMALYACVQIRAKTIGSLSLHLYRRKERGAERLTGERLYHLVHDSPNEEVSSASWRGTESSHIDLWGNGCAWIDRATVGRNAGGIRRLDPLKPERITISRENGRLKYGYKIRKANGQMEPVTYDRDQVLHIPGLSHDGVIGYSPVAIARQAIGLGLAFEEFEARFVGQGTHVSGLLVPKTVMKQAEYEIWKAGVKEQYAGLSQAGTLMVLSGDAEYTSLTMPLEDAQYLGLRRFQLEEMARLYRVPLILLQDQEKNTAWGSGIEQIMIGWVTFGIMSDVREWEQRMNMRLLTEAERAAGWYFEHDLNSLMRGDAKSRGEFYKLMREVSAFNPNNILQLENMNPRDDPGGEQYWDSGPQGQGSNQGSNQTSNMSARAQMAPVLTDTAARIMARENRDIAAAAEKWTKRDDMDGFVGWLGSYWAGHKAYCIETLLPVCTALGKPEMAVIGAKRHIETVQAALKLAQMAGIDAIKTCLEARDPSDLLLFEEE